MYGPAKQCGRDLGMLVSLEYWDVVLELRDWAIPPLCRHLRVTDTTLNGGTELLTVAFDALERQGRC